MKRLIWLAIAIYSWQSTHAKPEAQILKVGYDAYCLYTCLKEERDGFVIDLLRLILGRHGYELQTVHASWPRVKRLADQGDIDLLVPINAKETEQLGILRSSQSVGRSVAAYFTHKDSAWTYEGLASLSDQTLAIVKGYTYPPPLASFLQNPQNANRIVYLTSDQSTPTQIKMLANRRVTVAPVEIAVFWHNAHKLNLANQFRAAGTLHMPANIAIFYVGISTPHNQLAEKLLKLIDQELLSLKTLGGYQQILSRYQMGPTAPEPKIKKPLVRYERASGTVIRIIIGPPFRAPSEFRLKAQLHANTE
jgi:ABC-type amino acid transport substrate-binding protein